MRPVSLTSSTLAKSLRHSPAPLRCCPPAPLRSFSTSISRCAEENQNPAFSHQLYASTRERIIRERAEQRKFAEERDAARGNSTTSTIIAMFMIAGGFYFLGTMLPRSPDDTSTTTIEKSPSVTHNLEKKNLEAAWTDIVQVVGQENVSTAIAELQSRSGSEWSSYSPKAGEVPFCIASPGTTEEVSKIAKICHERKIPMTAYSGGTSLEGHFTPTRGGLCIDFGRMNKILKINKGDMDVVVQPAVGYQDLNEELAEVGLFFPPDPGPGAMIGGMVGTGCSGTNAYRYGTMKEWVLSLTVVLADGTIIKTRQRPRKSSAGYDLTRIFVGSEGTLGLVTEATLKLTTAPQNPRVAVATFPTIGAAAECVYKVVGDGVPIAAVEILDDEQMACINDAGSTSKQWKVAPTLFFKFAGTASGVKEQIAIVQKLAKASGSKSFEFAKNKEEGDELWSARKEALWSVMAKKRDPADHVWTTDVAVPISKLTEIIEATRADMDKSELYGTVLGHVGDGNFHAIILFSEKERKTAEGVVHRMVKRAIELEGTVTGEHGVGLIKRDYLEHELGQSTVDLMRKMKFAFDPLCLLNCDKVVRVEKPKAGEVEPW